MLSPVQGSPILSHNGSVNSWVNSNHQNLKVNQFLQMKDGGQHSLTEVARETSFEQNRNEYSHRLINDIFGENTTEQLQNSKEQKYEVIISNEEDDEENANDMQLQR